MRCGPGSYRCARSCAARPRSRLKAWGVELVEGDVTDPSSLAAAVAGADVVVHLVAIIKGAPRRLRAGDGAGDAHLVAAARDAGVRRFVLMSALGVDERTKDAVPYFGAKWEMEAAVRRPGSST